MKIHLLQLLLQAKFVDKGKLLREYERISRSPATPDVLKYLAISRPLENKVSTDLKDKDILAPNGRYKSMSQSSMVNSKDSIPAKATLNCNGLVEEKGISSTENKTTLILSSRVKPIEEIPASENLSNKEKAKKEDVSNGNYIYNDLLSPYNDLTTIKQRNSPSRLCQNGSSNQKNVKRDISCKRSGKDAVAEQNALSDDNANQKKDALSQFQFQKDVTEYLPTSKVNGDIDFPKLIRDEISSIDQHLIQEAKKSMQIGGMFIGPNYIHELSL